jgi:hypothetical protein
MAGVLKWLRGKLPDEELDVVEKFHADVSHDVQRHANMMRGVLRIRKLSMQLQDPVGYFPCRR